jgi:hypothetical protein
MIIAYLSSSPTGCKSRDDWLSENPETQHRITNHQDDEWNLAYERT